MAKKYKPLLSTYEWNEEWIELQKERRLADSSQYWDKRSKSYGASDQPSSYVDSFLGKAAIKPGESVLDMGCGTGTLCVPLARLGHQVIAADFSPGMLSRLEKAIADEQLNTIDTKRMSWSDDWEKQGVTENSVDVAIASRSIATANIKDSLMRLNSVARRRACITLTTGSSPRIDSRIIKAVGISDYAARDYQYALNILINEDLMPDLSYITSARKDTFDSFDDALQVFTDMLNEVNLGTDKPPLDIETRLRAWLTSHLIKNPEAGKENGQDSAQKAFCLDKPRSNTWAFISWETN